jgi:hypothetical protein
MKKTNIHLIKKSFYTLLVILSLALIMAAWADSTGRKIHLFILSGQSNMVGLDPDISFTPAVTKAFGNDEVIVVKDAVGAQSIRRWYRKWEPLPGEETKGTGTLEDLLIKKVKASIGGKTPNTITFVWMQGERDAKEKHGKIYASCLRAYLDEVRDDLGRKDVNFVIGRLSDFKNENYPDWELVRKAQVEVADSDPRCAWIDTDDLNGPRNDLHYTPEGYRILGERFAAKAIEMIKARTNLGE